MPFRRYALSYSANSQTKRAGAFPVLNGLFTVLLMTLSLASPHVLGQNTVVLDGSLDSRAIGKQLAYRIDPDKQLSLHDLQSQPEAFINSTDEVLNFGYTTDGIWIRFQLTNSLWKPVTRYLEFSSRFADQLILYAPDMNKEYQPIHSGRLVRPSDRPYPAREFAFPITVPAKASHTYYLYVDSADTLTVPLYLHTAQGLADAELSGRTWMAFYQGLIAAMTVFSLFLYYILRDRVYLLYIGAIVTHQGVFFTLFDGLGYSYLGLENSWWAREALSVFLCLAMWIITQFARTLLNSDKEQPRFDRIVVWLQHASLIVAVLSIFMDYAISIRIANPIASFTGIVLLVLGINGYRMGNPAARYFLLSWTSLIIGGLAYSMKSWGFMPSNLFTEYGWQAGSAIEAILLSMAISERVNNETQTRIRMQHKAQEAQTKAFMMQRQANETLERNVRERTEALERANRQLQALSETDDLTGLSNRRSLENQLQQALKRGAQSGSTVAVLLLDLDHFKAVNDNHGHLVGDECLRGVAERLRINSRWPADIVARYGGEEFCVLLHRASADMAMDTAERIRRSLDEEPIETRIGPLRVTMSIGVCAVVPTSEYQGDAFLAAADKALYASKQSGRNRVTLTGSIDPAGHSEKSIGV